jgi:hypothetical protein
MKNRKAIVANRHTLLSKVEKLVENVFNTPDAQWNSHTTVHHAFGGFLFETPGSSDEVIEGKTLNFWDPNPATYSDVDYDLPIEDLAKEWAKKSEGRVFFDLELWKNFSFTGRFSVWCDPVPLGRHRSNARSISFHYAAKFGEIRVMGRDSGGTRLTKKAVADFSDWLDDAAVTPIKFRPLE